MAAQEKEAENLKRNAAREVQGSGSTNGKKIRGKSDQKVLCEKPKRN